VKLLRRFAEAVMRRIFSLGEPSVKTRSPSETPTDEGAIFVQ
jgi:hypothetical protein